MHSKITLEKLFLFLFFASFFSLGKSQSSLKQSPNGLFKLTGKVLNESKEVIEVGNVLILSSKDSSLIQGDLFENGSFSIQNLTHRSFLLKITSLGFQEHYQWVENTTADRQLKIGNIILQSQLINGIEVVARHKIYEKRGENIVVNIANTSLSNAGTAMDVLRNSPKVTISSGGGISVLGKGTAIIYLDGQQIASTQILQTLSSNDLKEIEIIENPSAKYDAAGQAVISIITKSKTLEGFKIGLTQEVAQHKDFRSYFKVNTYFRASKFMFQTSYGIRPYIRGGREFYFRTYNSDDRLIEIDNKLNYARDLLLHDYNFRTSYQIDQQSKIGLQYTGSSLDGEKEAHNRNIFNQNGATAFQIDTDINGPYTQQNNIFSLFYERNLDTLGSNLLLSGQFSNYDLDRLENINQTLAINNNFSSLNRRSNNFNNIEVTSFQADYNKKFLKGTQWGSGVKNAHVANKSLLTFEREEEGGIFTPDPNFSSDYDYQENIFAAYSQLTFKAKSLKANVGIRGEWTKISGVSDSEGGGKLFARNYLDFFPSASLTKTFSDNLITTLNYNYRIQRPAFQDLNPFVFYVDSLVSLRGNADLVPEYTHALAASASWKSLSFSLNYSHTKDKINTIIRVDDLDNPGVFAFIRDNINRVDLWAASVSFPIQKSWYSSYTTLGVRAEKHKVADVGDDFLINKQSGYYFQTHQSFQLPVKIKLEVMYQYTSPRVDGIYRDNPISYFHIGASRPFFNNHLKVRIWGNDIFDKFKFRGISNFNNSHFTYLSEGDWHFVKLSLNWDFGKLGVGNFREKKLSREELGRINKEF